jgi:hypothetical protein
VLGRCVVQLTKSATFPSTAQDKMSIVQMMYTRLIQKSVLTVRLFVMKALVAPEAINVNSCGAPRVKLVTKSAIN